jgi:hypothetical protein
MEEKERKLKELEKEWTRKVDENDVDDEEDDNVHDIELGATNEMREEDEKDWIDDEKEEDWIDEDEVAFEASLKSVLEIRKGTWNSLMERLEVDAKETES